MHKVFWLEKYIKNSLLGARLIYNIFGKYLFLSNIVALLFYYLFFILPSNLKNKLGTIYLNNTGKLSNIVFYVKLSRTKLYNYIN